MRDRFEGSKLTRRSVLISALGSTSLLTGMAHFAEAGTKVSQSAVQYQPAPKDGQDCQHCYQFVMPHACKMVDGDSIVGDRRIFAQRRERGLVAIVAAPRSRNRILRSPDRTAQRDVSAVSRPYHPCVDGVSARRHDPVSGRLGLGCVHIGRGAAAAACGKHDRQDNPQHYRCPPAASVGPWRGNLTDGSRLTPTSRRLFERVPDRTATPTSQRGEPSR
jgi:hypothetical protein